MQHHKKTIAGIEFLSEGTYNHKHDGVAGNLRMLPSGKQFTLAPSSTYGCHGFIYVFTGTHIHFFCSVCIP